MMTFSRSLSLGAVSRLVCCSLAVSAALIASPARAQFADFTYGADARMYAMGGAGIALTQTRAIRMNPAMLAFDRYDMEPTFPAIGFRATGGISRDNSGGFMMRGLRNEDALALVRDFGGSDSDFGLNGAVGFRARNIEVSANAVAFGRLQPNESLRAWSQVSPRDYENLPRDVRGNVIAAGFYNLPAIAFGFKLPLQRDDARSRFARAVAPKSSRKSAFADNVVGMGVRLKYMSAVYAHYVTDYESILGVKSAPTAPEMNGQDTLTKRGVGMDLGIMVRPLSRYGNGISYGLVVANLLNPGFRFDGTDRNGNPTRVDLVKTTVSAGIGYEKNGTVLAFDIADMTGATGKAQLRIGAEQKVAAPLYLRAGYSTGVGPTFGLSLFGIDAAFGRRLPLEVIKTVRF